MSRDTCREFASEFRREEKDCYNLTQWGYLRTYARTGILLRGRSEMRQKWYPSGAKPRTYYAQGGDHYSASCHLQEIFGELVNCFVPTHHVTRLQPGRLRCQPLRSTLRIYDFTSFTSRFDEQYAFCNELAEFCVGIPVIVMDAREGPILRQLSDLIRDYNDICNDCPEVSYERFNGEEDMARNHCRSSMLGIFGNLMSDTFAHGVGLAMAMGEDMGVDDLNVAGDDAAYNQTEENEDPVNHILDAMGDFEQSKTFMVTDATPICLKRPISISEHQTYLHGHSIIPPNMALINHLLCDKNDPRYSFFDKEESESSRISTVGKDLMRMLRSAYRAQWKLDDDELQYVLDIVEGVRRMKHIPEHGGLPQCGSDRYFFPAVVDLSELRTVDPIISLVSRRFQGSVTIPVCEFERYSDLDNGLEEMIVGETFRCNSNARLAWLERLGYLSSKKERARYTGKKAYDYLVRLYSDHSTPAVNEYTVVETIPGCLLQ